MASVSVVMPCYNYGRFLGDALASVLDEQAGVDVRVLVIDDASSDGSAEIAMKLAARDPRVEVITHAVNKGPNATFNEGLLDWAEGDYSVLISADDLLTPGALRRAADFLDSHPGAGFVHGHAVQFRHGTPLPSPRTTVRGSSVWPGQRWLEHRFHLTTNFISSPTVLVRTSLQKRVGGYDIRLPHTADMEMWMRLAANADVGHLRGADQAYCRSHGRNMSMSFTPVMTLCQRRLAYESVLDRYGERLPDASRLSDLVHRKLSWEALWVAARAYDRGRVGQTPVDELMAFAIDCWPKAATLPMYRTLQLRRRIGPQVMPYLQPLVLSAVANKGARWWRGQSWKLRGF